MRKFSYVMHRSFVGWKYFHNERLGSFPRLEVIDCIENRKLLIKMKGSDVSAPVFSSVRVTR